MDRDDKRSLIERYLDAYHAFDIDAMVSAVHPDVDFKNISGGEVDATASGADEFRKLAEQSKEMLSSRKQTMVKFLIKDDRAFADVAYEGVLASDLPDEMKTGEDLRLNGRPAFTFCNGKIYRIKDIS